LELRSLYHKIGDIICRRIPLFPVAMGPDLMFCTPTVYEVWVTKNEFSTQKSADVSAVGSELLAACDGLLLAGRLPGPWPPLSLQVGIPPVNTLPPTVTVWKAAVISSDQRRMEGSVEKGQMLSSENVPKLVSLPFLFGKRSGGAELVLLWD
jgi:hypothetical protein